MTEPTSPSVTSLATRLEIDCEQWGLAIDKEVRGLRVALPGIIVSFNPVAQTAIVQCAIRETLTINGIPTHVNIPQLLDVPVIFPRGGGFVLTFPVSEGDECLVIFSDLCIDMWWQNGGIQNRREARRHNFSDAFAILGPFSQPNVLSSTVRWMIGGNYTAGNIVEFQGKNYLCLNDVDNSTDSPEEDTDNFSLVEEPFSNTSLQLRKIDGSVMLEITDSEINLTGNVNTTGNSSSDSGWSGSFQTLTGKIVTVQNGIIVDVGN
jgi:hypothetical protein